MADAIAVLTELKVDLPQEWHAAVDELAELSLAADKPLRLILVGAFAVGKSSLLNMLLGESILQASLGETTALPTFIEYGEARGMQLIGCDGSMLPLDEGAFARATTEAPDGAACAALSLPCQWLKGVSIIDLPGLGSLSSSNREYTLAQIRQADAVLYLLDPRGPSQTDLNTLKFIHETGKRIKVMVARWDIVEASISRGEKLPSLEEWAGQIATDSGLKVRIGSCCQSGLGREDILDFVQRAKDELGEIRLRRFYSELKPILENALGQNAESQRSCEVSSEEAAQEQHQRLMQRKQTLVDLKSDIYKQQQQSLEQIKQQVLAVLQQTRNQLSQQLSEQISFLASEADWNCFGEAGSVLLGSAVSGAARELSTLSNDYGLLDLPESQIAEFNLRLPSPEPVDMNDFLDMGKLSQLQYELETRESEFSAIEQKLAAMPVVDMSDNERALRELILQRQTLSTQPLPRILKRINNGNGAAVGRILGEIADIGLFFVNPAATGAKVASLVGKGAKMTKVASNVAKGIKIAKGIQVGTKVSGVPQPVMDKLGALEVLSFGYWGERVGAMLGGPVDEEVVDPQAYAEQNAALAAIDAQSTELRRVLARNEDIANEQHLTGWALEQNQKEQRRLQSELHRLQELAAKKHADAKKVQEADRKTLLARYADRAMNQWLRSFDQQTTSMSDLLRGTVKSYWEDRVEALVAERLDEIEALNSQAKASAEEKTAMLCRLRLEAASIHKTLQNLQ